ncbi:Dak phosphatase [Viridothelium virens]|uniref:Dak phosphatase n=1 Tax=Viridothelium virens TaxID=1048519 RepID=A0A6A6HHU0_VIRVR|nr:Dak phosphatase [Viridothelium virens]
MAVVVDQTIPFSKSDLDLENPARWNALLPLMRPSLRQAQTPKGQTILIDQSLQSSPYVQLAAIGRSGNFSSHLLSERNVVAIVTEKEGAGILTAHDILHTLQSAGISVSQGLVVARFGKETQIEPVHDNILEIEVDDELKLDHILALLSQATESAKVSLHQTADLLKVFLKTVTTSSATFQTGISDGKPVVLYGHGSEPYESAKGALQKDLKQAMKAHTAQNKSVTYSVHYSDINGLSRLENSILGLEIVSFLDEQNLPYRLSNSALLNHDSQARGWSISVCPVPQQLLAPQSKPAPPLETSQTAEQASTGSTKLTSKIQFDDATVRRRIINGCNKLIESEPTITEYDTIVGDGDCGYTLRSGAQQTLTFLSSHPSHLSALPTALSALVDQLSIDMGGTSGALYCIFLSSLAQSLLTSHSIADAAVDAKEHLLHFTRAREGDRTCLDCLIPFVEALRETRGDEQVALGRAREGVERTKELEARLGRSSYLDEGATKGVPDPGAYGLLMLLEGLCTD